MPGELRGSFSLDTSNGRIGLSSGELDFALTALHVGADHDVTADAWIRGRIDVRPTLEPTSIWRGWSSGSRTSGWVGGTATPWQGGINIDEGHVTVPIPAERTGVEPLSYLTETLEDQGFGKLLENADGRLGATLAFSRLAWIADRLGRPLGLALAGSGEIEVGLVLKDGRIGQGMKLQIPSRRLQLGMLDHRVAGQGWAALSVVKSRGESALQLDVEFADASVKRGNEQRPEADKMRLMAEILVPKSAAKHHSAPVLRMEIPSARIPDFSFLNAYLPPAAR